MRKTKADLEAEVAALTEQLGLAQLALASKHCGPWCPQCGPSMTLYPQATSTINPFAYGTIIY